MTPVLAIGGAAVLLATGAAVARQLSFRTLPFSSEFIPSEAIAVSPDGTVIVGVGESVGREAFRWSMSAGIEPLGQLPGGGFSVAMGVSGNGQLVVGSSNLPGLGYQPFTWTRDTGMRHLEPPGGGSYASVHDASFDGSIVVGHFNIGGAFVFDADGTARSIPLRFAPAVTPDGRQVVGTTNGTIAAVYDLGTSMLREVGHLPGHAYSYGNDITPDGSVVVGASLATGYTDERAFIWTEEVGAVMPIVGDGSFVPRSAHAVSADGKVIVGRHDDGMYVWTEAGGARDLRDVLGELVPDGLRFRTVRGISADGTVIVGGASWGFGGENAAWVATIPAPATFPALAVLALTRLQGRTRRP